MYRKHKRKMIVDKRKTLMKNKRKNKGYKNTSTLESEFHNS